ncbi:MAG: rhodanese-like domain-containing protein [Acidobacteriota bacterium]|nr:rhodanese-like domain-containing protein [Acidobacteriota bacterium]
MRRAALFLLFLSAVLTAGDPWTANDLMQPKDVAAHLKGPLVLQVGFNVLYRAAHIAGTQYAGPGSKAEGIDLLKKTVANEPHNREIILYCGCCPWEKCPNIRPAFAALHDMGFTHVKVMVVPENLKADWIDKGYPTDKRAGE